MGPARITGNLSVLINHSLIITGTLWVEGNITLGNNSSVKLDSGYGSSSGIIISDGRIDMGNNTEFGGSGSEGSFILILSTSNCPFGLGCSGDAIELVNNSVGAILNAQNGAISFANNAVATEATAYRLILRQNVVITYESGLANVNFSTGPTGGWNVKNWRETE